MVSLTHSPILFDFFVEEIFGGEKMVIHLMA